LKRNINKCNSDTKQLAYFSLVRPQIEYAASAWDPHLSMNVKALEDIQRRSARFVLSDYHRTSSVSAMLQRLAWPTLQSRRRLSRLTLLYKAINGSIAIPVDDLSLMTRATRMNSGFSKVYTLISSTCDAYKYSFYPRTVKDWNNLTDGIRNAANTDAFNSAASKCVLELY